LKSIETLAYVDEQGRLTASVPLSEGTYKVVLVAEKVSPKAPTPLDFLIFDVGEWNEQWTLRREDEYADNEN